MAKNGVVIKSFQNGIEVVLPDDIEFDELKEQVRDKFVSSARLLGNAVIALSFCNRSLSNEEENELIKIISESCSVDISCVLEKDLERNEIYLKALNQFAKAQSAAKGEVYKGCVRAGNTIETPYSIIVVGDVNPGATIISEGNIVVLGTLYGSAYAGPECFIASLDMKPERLGIGDTVMVLEGRSLKNSILSKNTARIAYISDESIEIEVITKEFLNNLPF